MPGLHSLFHWLSIRWTHLLGVLVIIGIVTISGALLVVWSGIYNVAASRGHLAIIDVVLRFAMENSVKRRAPDAAPFPLDDPDLIILGAAHFHSGCAVCHGMPGKTVNPVFQQMLPPPPELTTQVEKWSDGELFWIVKHGLKYAGMPAWPSQNRDDEVWAIVAFLRTLPTLDNESYLALALGATRRDPPSGREYAIGMRSADTTTACSRCHGSDDIAPRSNRVPRLHNQSPEMLLNALRAFAAGDRYSGIMEPIASDLSPSLMVEVARYYSELPALMQTQTAVQEGNVAEGRRLALDGDADSGIPACQGCHGANALPLYPRLAGQNAAYVIGQLRAWRGGAKGRTDTDAIMAPLARRLTDQQILDTAAYYSSVAAGAP